MVDRNESGIRENVEEENHEVDIPVTCMEEEKGTDRVSNKTITSRNKTEYTLDSSPAEIPDICGREDSTFDAENLYHQTVKTKSHSLTELRKCKEIESKDVLNEGKHEDLNNTEHIGFNYISIAPTVTLENMVLDGDVGEETSVTNTIPNGKQ